MKTEQISIRLLDLKLARAVAEDLRISVAAVINASTRKHFHPHLTQNTTILEAMERIGKKMPPAAVGRKEEKPKAEPVAYICSDSCCVICKGFCRHECVDGYATVAEAVRAGSCAETCLSTCETFTTSPEGAAKPRVRDSHTTKWQKKR